MSANSTQKVNPKVWKKIVAKYPYDFCPRMIFKNEDKWLWQADVETTIDISNWLLHWNVDGKDILLTMSDFNSKYS
jgi:hypothetical protein